MISDYVHNMVVYQESVLTRLEKEIGFQCWIESAQTSCYYKKWPFNNHMANYNHNFYLVCPILINDQ
jgi:hypothetical protein